ncbi:GATA zinc finger domain-containing protein 4-like [Musca domestica]|uniref:GATA zinc finger domain-containing protein 4-like n=1 Tax=Musca domestica TaxID=7370 RepID=A0ABM3VHD0_MUSDO|nr:GATA zinc finger domain-containing protein 4-like [Musca domestica]XP_058981072.1 GATA zinc finger domain-containing protein 4-like [Musca domestica]XP_058981073.1 GATA zinc finger domain-containing protein 4-like [Musca domestica]XP_058981964.1 GATA zinc finger domain-containing protein 4-like [Musca domestica]XP_058985196.1 GATA zinc finger domain-containing protein 4-like [Musca domestica]
MYSQRQKVFDKRRRMEEQAHIASVNVAEELARKDQQLERLRQAYLELQQQTQELQQQQRNPVLYDTQSNNAKDNILKTINHLPIFTGTGEVTVNSFFSSTEYLLSTIQDENIKKEAIRTIFYKIIQGQAKDVIINIPTPDNWQLIKETLKLRYRPNVEPHNIYRMIANLKVNSVSELIIELQNLKYKADELIVYYRNDHYIDLSNVDSLLVNTIKEMTQGTLLDKIYEERNINDILKILTRRRFEDTCIRPEYRKFRTKDDVTFRQNRSQNRNNFNPQINSNNQGYNQRNWLGQNNFRSDIRQERNNNDNNKTYNNNNNDNYNRNRNFNHSGQYRVQQNNSYNNNYNNRNQNGNFNHSGQYRVQQSNYNNMSGNFRRFQQQVGNPRPNFSQNRLNQPRQDQQEPMEIDNIEVDNYRVVGNSEPNLHQDNGQDQRQNNFFRKQPPIVYLP